MTPCQPDAAASSQLADTPLLWPARSECRQATNNRYAAPGDPLTSASHVAGALTVSEANAMGSSSWQVMTSRSSQSNSPSASFREPPT
jgi:hypothetical protein